MEGDAGSGRLNPTDEHSRDDDSRTETATDEPKESAAVLVAEHDDLAEGETSESADSDDPPSDDESGDGRRQERFGRGWFLGICAALLVVAIAVGVGGFLAMRAQAADRVMAADDALALDRAKECVAATQAPDIAAMTASQSKIIECSAGDFAVQANLYAGMLVEAYQAAQAAVKVSELRAAVERHNPDGSVVVMVAVRVKVTNSQAADQEQGYRLRATMVKEDGTYKISKLDQVTS
jgi:Mce-associated membrane protein